MRLEITKKLPRLNLRFLKSPLKKSVCECRNSVLRNNSSRLNNRLKPHNSHNSAKLRLEI